MSMSRCIHGRRRRSGEQVDNEAVITPVFKTARKSLVADQVRRQLGLDQAPAQGQEAEGNVGKRVPNFDLDGLDAAFTCAARLRVAAPRRQVSAWRLRAAAARGDPSRRRSARRAARSWRSLCRRTRRRKSMCVGAMKNSAWSSRDVHCRRESASFSNEKRSPQTPTCIAATARRCSEPAIVDEAFEVVRPPPA